ncbi:hypothetical protein ACHAXA_004808 [Cyclostephanos tholiformis]|uniref:Uncharacterized protein n=1 Tax=Cyclostephanos tholiformis TaxID=382380 RepID=A0ABD3RWS3_9STRA
MSDECIIINEHGVDALRDEDGMHALAPLASDSLVASTTAFSVAATAGAATADNSMGGRIIISYKQHMIDVSKLTYPIILSEIFQNTLPVVDLGFVGQLGKNELASAALATVWFNLWNATMIGFMTAIDTLLSQSHGANRLDNYSVWTGNSVMIIIPATAIASGAVALCGPALKLLGQDHKLADAAAQYSYRLIPGLFPYYLFKVQTKYLQNQNRLSPGVWIGLFANFLNALFNWSLIYEVGWGLMGAPWATTLTRLAEFLLMSLYICLNRHTSLRETWPRFAVENMRPSVLKPFWNMAIAGALGFAAEAWSFEVTTILAGLLGTVPLDAHVITLTFSTFVYLSFPFAVSIAASIRIGQLIGDQRPSDARRSAHTSYFLVCIIQLVLISIILPLTKVLGKVFSSDLDVQQLVAQLIPISCAFMMGDSIQSTNSGGPRRRRNNGGGNNESWKIWKRRMGGGYDVVDNAVNDSSVEDRGKGDANSMISSSSSSDDEVRCFGRMDDDAPRKDDVNVMRRDNDIFGGKGRHGGGMLLLPIIRPFLRGSRTGFTDNGDPSLHPSCGMVDDEENDAADYLDVPPSSRDRAAVMKSISMGIVGTTDDTLLIDANREDDGSHRPGAELRPPIWLERIFPARRFRNQYSNCPIMQLHGLIRREDWSLATTLLRSKPDLARTWHPISRLYGGRYDGEALPIHAAAALRPPPSFIEMLATLYPGGLLEKDKAFGRVPLHIACRSVASSSVIRVLCEMDPTCVEERDEYVSFTRL